MINLIPPDILLKRGANWIIRKWSIRLLVVSGICGCLFLTTLKLIDRQNDLLEKRKIEFNLVLTKLNEAEILLAQRDRIWENWDTIRSIHNPKTSAWFLELLGRSLPKKSYINSLRLTIPGVDDKTGFSGIQTDQPGMLRFSGAASGHHEVGEIIQALFTSGAFKDVNLISVSDPGRVARQTDLLFEMQCITSDQH